MIRHITSGYANKMNIGKIINGDESTIFLKNKCAFKPIENDQVNNIYRFVINLSKIKH